MGILLKDKQNEQLQNNETQTESRENRLLRKQLPDVQIEKSERSYRVVFPLPGADKEKLSVKVEDGQLKVAGVYRDTSKAGYKLVHSDRFAWQAFERWLRVDESKFDLDKIEAELHQGILEIEMPLKPEVLPKEIEIQVK